MTRHGSMGAPWSGRHDATHGDRVQRRLSGWCHAVCQTFARSRLGPVHTNRSPSAMSAKLINAMNMASSFSNREKIRRNPLSRWHSRSISLRRLYMARLYSQGVIRFTFGGTTGMKPSSLPLDKPRNDSIRTWQNPENRTTRRPTWASKLSSRAPPTRCATPWMRPVYKLGRRQYQSKFGRVAP